MLEENQNNLKQFVVCYDGHLDNEWLDEVVAVERKTMLKSAFKQATRDIRHKFVQTAYTACIHVINDVRHNPVR